MANDRKSAFGMYEELLSQQTDYENNRDGVPANSLNLNKYFVGGDVVDDDCEEFMTSAEIVKNKEARRAVEEKLGITSSPIDDGIIEESIHFKRYTKRREHKYTDKEMIDIRSSCHRTIVHDYGEFDIYHISDEERAKNDQLAEISMKLARLKRTYRRVDQYIDAMRIVFEAWAILERGNYIHTRDEFYQLIADGKIVSNRIIIPKLKRIDQYNMDVIINYISNPELDASHLAPKKNDKVHDSFFDEDEWNEETEEEEMARLLSPEEVEMVLGNPQRMEIGYIKSKYIKGYDRRSIKKKKKRKGNKHDRYIKEGLAEMLNKIQNGQHYKDHGNSYMVTHSLFEPEKSEKSIFDNLHFDGSWANKDDVALYELVVQEEILKQHPVKDKYKTYADIKLQNFFKVLEDNGVSAIELRRKIDVTGELINHRKEKAVRKENKKLESAIIQRISKLNKTPKFKKIVEKAEDALNKYRDGEPR